MTSPPTLPAILLLAASALPACAERPASAELPASASAAPSPASIASSAPAATEPPAPADAGSPDAEVTLAATATAAEPPPACPDHMALVTRFCIDRDEAHLVAPGPDGLLAPLPHNQRPPADVRFEARSAAGVFPQGYVSRVEAAAACTNAGKRLCSMREWRRACEGKGTTTFPYGRRRVAGRCNNEKAHLLSIKFGSNPNRWKYDNFNDPSLDAEPGFLARTGAFDGCSSAEGVHDLVGNLHEWVSDTVDDALVEKLDNEDVTRVWQPSKTGNGVFLGGFFSTADQHGPGCSFTTIAHEPTYHDYSIGFRCCAAANLPPAPPRPQKSRRR